MPSRFARYLKLVLLLTLDRRRLRPRRSKTTWARRVCRHKSAQARRPAVVPFVIVHPDESMSLGCSHDVQEAIRVFAKTSTGLFYRPCTLHRDGDHIDVSGFAEGSMLDCRSVSAERYELRCTIRRAGAAEPIHLRIRCLKRSDYAQLVSIGASYVPKSLLDIA